MFVRQADASSCSASGNEHVVTASLVESVAGECTVPMCMLVTRSGSPDRRATTLLRKLLRVRSA